MRSVPQTLSGWSAYHIGPWNWSWDIKMNKAAQRETQYKGRERYRESTAPQYKHGS